MIVSKAGVAGGRLVYHFFNKFTQRPMEVQNEILEEIMKKNKDTEYGKKYGFADIHSLREYQDKVPLSTFEDYSGYVERMIHGGEKDLITTYKISRYCSSSGSVGKPKLLPKSKKDALNMYNMGLCGPMGLLYQYRKSIGEKVPNLYGPLVLVLTGHKLENGMMSNGAGQVPLTYVKPLSRWFTTSPVEVMYPEHEERIDMPYMQLRFALPERHVTFLGSLVITLLSNMFEDLEVKWPMLCDDIEKGTINPGVKCPPEVRAKLEKKLRPMPERAAELRREFEKGFDDPICPRIWPELVWGYGMFGSNLAIYVKRLRRWIGPDLPMHNMGFAAAEGYYAMPVEMNATDYCLLPRSIIFEFLPIDAPEDSRPLFMDELETGREYEMIITNFSGLYRYRTFDVIKKTGMHNNTPRVEFMYRRNLGMNIANEKTTTQMLDYAADTTAEQMGIQLEGHSFYGDYDTNPVHYTLLLEPVNDVDEAQIPAIVEALDKNLGYSNEKYEKYRRWGFLGTPEVIILKKGAYVAYREMLRSRGVVLNQIKPVTVINSDERREFFFGQAEKRIPYKNIPLVTAEEVAGGTKP